MKSVLISIQPKWCELIASGKKTIEVRKSVPKLERPFKCYIYCTQTKTIGDIILCKSEENAKLFGYNTVKGINKGFAEKEDIKLKGKVIGEFVCDKVLEWKYLPDHTDEKEYEYYIECADGHATCLTYDEIYNYGKGKTLYGWHISALKIYDKPKELSAFKKQNACYYQGDMDNLGCWEGGCVEQELGWCDGRCSVVWKAPQSWCYVESLGE